VIRGQCGVGSDDSVVALDHFEYGMDDEQANLQKLEILEYLVFGRKRKVIIVTTIDPEFWFESALDDLPKPSSKSVLAGRDTQRWTRLLARFKLFRLEASTPASRTKAYYQFLWETCTPSEQVALFHLAEGGWANHKNGAALRHLRQRGQPLPERQQGPDFEAREAAPNLRKLALHAFSAVAEVRGRRSALSAAGNETAAPIKAAQGEDPCTKMSAPLAM